MRNKHLWTSLVVGLVIAGGAVAGNVTLPNVFQANTPARAAEVNANFTAVKTAVDDNQSQITALSARVTTVEGRACPTGTVKVGAVCLETAVRGSGTHTVAETACITAGRGLCPRATLLARCRGNMATFSADEWAAETHPARDSAGAFQVLIDTVSVSGAQCVADYLTATSTLPLAYRCCTNP